MRMKTSHKIGIGADIEEIARFERARKDPLLKKLFTSRELSYCFSKKRPAPHLAARFCGKEVVIKALLQLGATRMSFADVEIVSGKGGAPSVSLSKRLAGRYVAFVSLSHARSYAFACAIAYRLG